MLVSRLYCYFKYVYGHSFEPNPFQATDSDILLNSKATGQRAEGEANAPSQAQTREDPKTSRELSQVQLDLIQCTM